LFWSRVAARFEVRNVLPPEVNPKVIAAKKFSGARCGVDFVGDQLRGNKHDLIAIEPLSETQEFLAPIGGTFIAQAGGGDRIEQRDRGPFDRAGLPRREAIARTLACLKRSGARRRQRRAFGFCEASPHAAFGPFGDNIKASRTRMPRRRGLS
jgi:hypothetical protein